MGLKTLPSSLRQKERYIIFAIEAEQDYSLGGVVDVIWKEMISFLGEKEVAQMNPWIMGDLFSRKKQIGGIRVNKDYVEEARTALALLDRIDDAKICIHVIGVAGTIQSARDKYLEAVQ
jgi:ribonuclease P/MRP protein subunit POP5